FNDLNDQLKHSMSAVEKEQRKLSSVLSNMSEGVISTDKDGQIILVNDAAGKLIGHNPKQLIGEFLLDFLDLEDRIIDITELQTTGSMIIEDRKSTRLNSSHVSISYAVFCLKKKKKTKLLEY